MTSSERTYQTIDAHAGGEPLRIVLSGVPEIPGSTMLEKRRYMRDHLDQIRTTLMLEPRGHTDMYGCVMTPPVSEGSDMGVLFMHNEGYSTMCGHGVIALVTVAVARDLVSDPLSIVIDTPAGVVRALANMRDGSVQSVSFRNVPSFVVERALSVDGMRVDVAFGGAFYAIVQESPLPIDRTHLPDLRELGMKIKRAVEDMRTVVHPLESGLTGIYGTIFCGPASREGATLRNVTIFADAEVDRSPCGTGTCAVMALRRAEGKLSVDESFVNESLIGTIFTGRIVGEVEVGQNSAIIPEITGSAYVTGYNTFVVDASDPVGEGFRV
jgi:proline racemase